MARDFTLKTYRRLLDSLQKAGYVFFAFEDYEKADKSKKAVILRHDVDLRPGQSVKTAVIENEIGIRGSYYFRIVKGSNHPEKIERIRDLGHEIGYHYEDLAICKGDLIEAWDNFQMNLLYFREFYPVKTICMHGSPRSPHDSRDLWKKFNYKKKGIIGEPYFDVDFDSWFYLTDTGRRWDGWNVSVRDKVAQQQRWVKEGMVFRSSEDICKAALDEELVQKIMITIHPQRWDDNLVSWLRELIFQKVKNHGKRIINLNI